ncbi:hypothetical protein, partial [uncultured Sphingomonas sp.]|uniref:hypothetical protein n=1 Tax=uncultured Sphingomonas sp. TaxID=158754 RepID=UPI0025CF388B
MGEPVISLPDWEGQSRSWAANRLRLADRGLIFPKYAPDCLFPKCGIGDGVSGKLERSKTGVTEP